MQRNLLRPLAECKHLLRYFYVFWVLNDSRKFLPIQFGIYCRVGQERHSNIFLDPKEIYPPHCSSSTVLLHHHPQFSPTFFFAQLQFHNPSTTNLRFWPTSCHFSLSFSFILMVWRTRNPFNQPFSTKKCIEHYTFFFFLQGGRKCFVGPSCRVCQRRRQSQTQGRWSPQEYQTLGYSICGTLYTNVFGCALDNM